jgi:hypothetical protein
MNWPLADSVRAVAPLLPRRLFTKDAVRDLESIARTVGGTMDAFGFECRLGRGAARVDLGARHAPHAAVGRDGWVPGRRFRKLVSFVFSEWDAPDHKTDGLPRVPVPSVFLGLAPGDADSAAAVVGLRRLLLDLMGTPSFARCDRTLARCIEALPARARVHVVGAMIGRSRQSARLSVSLPRERVAGYLARLGRGRCGRTTARIVRNFSSCPGAAVIDFDVEREIGPTIGVHVPASGNVALVLARLLDAGLCSAGKMRAVLAWERVVTLRLRRGGWLCRLHWYVDHLKIVCGPDGPLEAKVYLGIAPALCLVR